MKDADQLFFPVVVGGCLFGGWFLCLFGSVVLGLFLFSLRLFNLNCRYPRDQLQPARKKKIVILTSINTSSISSSLYPGRAKQG